MMQTRSTFRGAGIGRRPRAAKPAASEARRRAARERLIALSRLMDAAVEVPALRTRVGLDALLGLVPGIGDLVSAGLGVFLVTEARHLGASRWLQARMLGNLLVDLGVGAVPVAGDLFDVYFKAHMRNLKLLQKELGEPFVDGVGRAGEVIEGELIASPDPRRP
jgi:hypothetical protein